MKRRGLTIPEVLVGAFVASILLLVMVQLLVVGLRVGREELERSASEQTALIIFKKLESDLALSNATGTSLSSDGSRCAFHPLNTVSNERQMVYFPRLTAWTFDPAAKLLARSEVLPAPPGLDFGTVGRRLTEAELMALPGPQASDRRMNLWSKIELFKLSNRGSLAPPNISSALELELRISIDGAATRKSFSLVEVVRFGTGGS